MNLNLEPFEKQVIVRKLTLDDFDQLIAMQKRCFPGMKTWDKKQIESQLRVFPAGQIVVEYDGRLAATSASLIIDFDEYAEHHDWLEVSDRGYIRNHDPEGDTLYGIEIMVDPEFRGMKLARRLYEARKQLCAQLNLKRIAVGGRIPGFADHKDELTAREYVQQVVAKNLYDPVLTAQLASGFVLKRLIRSYLEDDKESDSWATLLEWVNIDYVPDGRRRLRRSRTVRLCAVQYKMRHIESFDELAQQCRYFVDAASGYRADFVVFPELLTTQMMSFLPTKIPAQAVRALTEYTSEYLELFSNLAVQFDINIVGGSHFAMEDDRLLNIAYLFHRDGRIDRQPKLHITPNERRWWGAQPGNELKVFDTDKGKVAIHVCYDVEFPELSRLAVERGARILFVPFCTDERQGYLRVRYCAQARCVENQVYAVISGTVGNLPEVENMDIQYAQSAILTPSDFAFSRDAIGAECTPNIETLVIHDVDLETLERFRQKGTVTNWLDQRKDLYEVRWLGEEQS